MQQAAEQIDVRAVIDGVGVAAGVRPRLCALAAYLIAVCTYRFYFPVMYLDDAVIHWLLDRVAGFPFDGAGAQD